MIIQKKNETHLAIVKIEDLKWLIENVYSYNSLLTSHQASRYEILKLGILNNIKSFKTENELNNYIKNINISPDISCFLGKENESFLDNWILGFLNGPRSEEVSFTYSKKKTKILNIEEYW